MQQPDLQSDTMFPTRPLTLFISVLAVFMIGQVLLMQLPILDQLAVIISQLVFILGAALVYRGYFARPETRWPKLGRLGMSPMGLVVVVVASIALGLLANVLGALTIYLFPALEPMADAYQEQIETLLLDQTMTAQILGAIGVVIVAPVAEEILFRGTILAEQRREQIAVSAILLNGILFSVMHLNPVAFVALAVVGCYFAHVTVRSGSLWPAIIGHAALNLVNGVVLLRIVEDVPDPADIAIVEILVALAVLLPITALLWWGSLRLMPDSDEQVTNDGKQEQPGPKW